MIGVKDQEQPQRKDFVGIRFLDTNVVQPEQVCQRLLILASLREQSNQPQQALTDYYRAYQLNPYQPAVAERIARPSAASSMNQRCEARVVSVMRPSIPADVRSRTAPTSSSSRPPTP